MKLVEIEPGYEAVIRRTGKTTGFVTLKRFIHKWPRENHRRKRTSSKHIVQTDT